MTPRPYQSSCIQAVEREWQTHQSTLAVMPTGTGKTVVFSHIIKDRPGRSIVIVHREELIWQAAQKIEQITGEKPDIEMAELRADRHHFWRSKCVVASIQTLTSGGSTERLSRFNPQEFQTIICDESHRSVSRTWRTAVNHFMQNPNARLLGVTATPLRADKVALGKMFESVAFRYEISDAVNDGWLVPIESQIIIADAIDLSSVRSVGGVMNASDLEREYTYERPLQQVAIPTMELAGTKRTLVFAVSVKHAERLAEIFNRYREGCARCVCRKTPREIRRQMFKDYSAGKFQFLVNVGVLIEGWDEPAVEVVALAQPTESVGLLTQMCGRGTRPLAGIVDQYSESEDRRMAISESAKPNLLILDFVGNCGKHKLVGVADVLGGKEPPAVIALATARMKAAGKSMNVIAAMQSAAREHREKIELEKKHEAERRRIASHECDVLEKDF